MTRKHPLRPVLTGLATAVAAAALAGSAQAITISGLSITNATTTPSTGLAADRGVSQGTQILSSSATGFSTRFRTTGAADTGFGSGTDTNQSTDMNYTISFSVTHALGVNYQLDIATSLLGALTVVDDGTVDGVASVGPVTGTRTGPGTLSGSLSLGGTSTRGPAAGNTVVSRNGSATIFGVGTGAAQAFTLKFTASFDATSDQALITGGDEAAYRFGLNGATGDILDVATADDYPGTGGRSGLADGHFVSLTAVPEPGTLLLLGSGFAGLAVLGRRRA